MRRLVLLATCLIAGPALIEAAGAGPMTNDMDLVYARYHMAIRAAELCRGVTADDRIWRKWSSYIDRKTDYELGAGERLSVLEGAKDDATIMVRRQGCEDDDVKDLLALYDAELAPLARYTALPLYSVWIFVKFRLTDSVGPAFVSALVPPATFVNSCSVSARAASSLVFTSVSGGLGSFLDVVM